MPTHAASTYQAAVIDDVRRGEGDTLVVARAGVGKTWTLVEAAKGLYTAALALAYNTRIVEELRTRLMGIPTGAQARSFGSLGLGALRQAYGDGVDTDEKHKRDRARDAVQRLFPRMPPKAQRPVVRAVAALADYAKHTLLTESLEDLDEAARRSGHGVPGVGRQALLEAAQLALASAKADPTKVDFADQVWLPVALGLPVIRVGKVLIDEAQDLDPAQIALARMAVAPGGRTTAVGDDFQALYAWRGADARALERVVSPRRRLSLPVSYRVPRSGVELARVIAPDIEAAPGAEEGVVDWCDRWVVETDPEPGDFVLSRTNAPLLSLCLRYLRDGKPAVVAGRKVGQGLVAFIESSNTYRVEDLYRWTSDFFDAETARLAELDNPELIPALVDKVEAVLALCDGLDDTREVVERVERLFADAEDDRGRIVCSTVHRAKGLERPRVFVDHETFFRPGRQGWRPIRRRADANVYYVMCTRHRQELVLCGGPRPGYVELESEDDKKGAVL